MTCEPVNLCDETDPIATPEQRAAYLEASQDLMGLTEVLCVVVLFIIGAALLARVAVRAAGLA